jgi:hypothetical protein
MAAHLLSDVGRVEGAVGWVYASTLGFALVYLGEHYVVDLLPASPSRRRSAATAPRLPAAAGRGADSPAPGSRGARMTRRRAHASAEGEPHGPWEDEAHHDEEMPRIQVTRRSLVLGFVSVAAIVAFLYFVVPTLGDVEDGLSRIRDGNAVWLTIAVGFSVLSFVGYVATFKGVYVPAGDRVRRRIGFRESYQITMASLAATRLFAAGRRGRRGAHGVGTARAGMPPRMVADRTIAFLVLHVRDLHGGA